MTAKFPVEVNDNEGIVDAINYLMSGPSGLGQNFDGFSDYNSAYLTGTFRAPFTVPITTTPPPTLSVAPIAIGNITVPNNPGNIIDVFYAAPQTPAPFAQGDSVTISGVTPGFYDDNYNRSVLEVSSTHILLQYNTTNLITWPAYVSGGTIEKNASNIDNSTDCNGRVTVYGPTDKVFLSAQINLDFTYDCTVTSEWDIKVKINRYVGTPTTTPGDNDYLFDLDTDPLVSQQVTHYSAAASGTSGNVEYIFTTVLDQPNFGYYWYILDIEFATLNPLLGGLLEQEYGQTDAYTFSGTSATQAVTTDYVNVIPTTLTGIGSGADIDIQLLEGASAAYTEANTTINYINSAGSDYAVGDTLLVLGTDLGGASPANDLTLTIVTVDPQYYPGDVTPGVFTLGLRSFTAQVIKQ
jgi:hypothetical protein